MIVSILTVIYLLFYKRKQEPVECSSDDSTSADTGNLRHDSQHDADHVKTEQVEEEQVEADQDETDQSEAEVVEPNLTDLKQADTDQDDAELVDVELVNPEPIGADKVKPEPIGADKVKPELIGPEKVKPELIGAEKAGTEQIDDDEVLQSFNRYWNDYRHSDQQLKEGETITEEVLEDDTIHVAPYQPKEQTGETRL